MSPLGPALSIAGVDLYGVLLAGLPTHIVTSVTDTLLFPPQAGAEIRLIK